jgi:GH25 family lysozyme M1 (1,4-beta-N-acetylmuramidase)
MQDEITFVPAYAGQFLRDYQSKPNIHSLTNDSYAKTTRLTPDFFSATIPNEVQFPDVSFWQGEINWDIMAANTKAVIIRIGQAKFVDVQFERNYAEAIKRGLKVGFYFFYDDRYSPGEQAETVLNALAGKQIDMEVFIDWETSYGGQFKGLPNVVALMQATEAGLPGVDVGMYSGYYWFRENSNAITHASQYAYLKNKPLWLAWYANDPIYVLIPAPWSSMAHWQFGTPAVSWGQATKELDMNYCGCTAQEFVVRYGKTNDDEGDNEPMKYKVLWSQGVARRYAPHTGTATQSTYTGLVYTYPTEVDVIEENIPDALDPANVNKVWVKFVDGYYGAAKYPDSMGVPRVRMEKIEVPVPDPDPVPDPAPCESETFVLKVAGFKEFSGLLECE